jgi:hypothetical protein
MRWAGRAMTALPVLFLTFDAVIHIMNILIVVETMKGLGWDATMGPVLGIIEIICLALYVIPRTSILGAILLTGYLGGAVATNVRVGSPLFSHDLFPVYVGILLWVGLTLRHEKLRAALS